MKYIIHHANGFLKEQLADAEGKTIKEAHEEVKRICEEKGWHLSNVWLEPVE